MNSDQYAFTTAIDVHLRDIDTGGHVNNAVFVEYLEQARIEYLDDAVDYLENETFIVIAALEMQFLNPVRWKDTVLVDVRIAELGTSSFRMQYRLRVDEVVVATAETVTVTYDEQTDESVPIPSTWRDRIVAENAQFLKDESA